ncbi:MAG: site-specific DNA-methyltransferase [Candidatus Diapherotrites archaeon]|nr:site-specific DNA-methyltransferase [Candidatus Diapherotrites archaeon]
MRRMSLRAPKEIADWVTFKKNFEHPIHNWFYYKEGFSKELVDWFIQEFMLRGPIYDPFCGCGTTLLTAKQRNIKSYGIDISPLAVLVSKAKTRNYDTKKLRFFLDFCVKKERYAKAQKIFRRYFHKENIGDICNIKQNIKELKDERARDFLMLALIDSASKVALVKKQGRSLRRIKRSFFPLKKIFRRKAESMIRDLESHQAIGPEPIIKEADARFYQLKKKVQSIITSPPYLGKEEYAKVYKLELGLFLDQPTPCLHTYIGSDVSKNQAENFSLSEMHKDLPNEALAYFSDMKKAIEKMYQSLQKGGLAFLVVAGGCLPDLIVESDEVIETIAEDSGFTKLDRIFARKVPCMRNRIELVGKTRESILVLEKGG